MPTLRGMLSDPRLGILGIIGPALAFACIGTSIMLSPWFSLTDNALSDLGVGSAAIIFNLGLVACGILSAVLALGLLASASRYPGAPGSFLLLLACISLVGIGIFTEDYAPHHYYFSVAFFVLLLLAALTTSLTAVLDRNLTGAVIPGLVAVIGIAGWVLSPFRGVAVPELLSAVPGAMWVAGMGYTYWRGNMRSPGVD